MSVPIISIISILLFLTAILLFPLLYGKYYGMPVLRTIALGGIALFGTYLVYQTVTHIYSIDELGFVGLCIGILAIGGFFLILGMNQRVSARYELINPRILSVTLVVYFVGLFLPPYAASSIEAFCANTHKLDAVKIIEAVNKYETSQNTFPSNLNSLLPVYLKEVPSPECFSVYRPLVPILTNTEFLRTMNYWVMKDLIKLKDLDYHLTKCEWEEDNVLHADSYLIVPTIDLNDKDRFDFSSSSWSRIPYHYDECSGSVPD